MAPNSTLHHLKETIKLAIPIVLSQLGQNCFGIMDSAMVGRLGAAPLSASAFVNNVTNIPMIFIFGVTSAVSVLAAQNFGAKNYKDCGRLLNNSLVYVSILALIIILGLEFLTPFLTIFRQPEEVLAISYPFYHAITWSIFPFILFFVLKQFSEGLSHPAVPLIFLGVGLFLNFFLNYIFIYGHFGLPALGLLGSGLATLISRWAVVIFLFIYILKSTKYEKFLVKFNRENFDRSIMQNITRIGIPSGFQYFFEVAAFAGCGIMMGWLGTKTLASHQIAIQVASFTFMFALGFSFATSVRIGQLKGEMDYRGLRRVGLSSFAFIAGFQFFLGVCILLMRNVLPGWFINDEEVRIFTSQLMVIAFLFQIFDGIQAVGVSALRGIQDVKIPTIATFISYWVVALPLAYVLAFTLNYRHQGIWAALGVGLFVASCFLISRFNYKTKKLLIEYKHLMVTNE
jgi:MATE family multidrug resistance protein